MVVRWPKTASLGKQSAAMLILTFMDFCFTSSPPLLPPPPGLPSRAAGKSMNERLPSLPKR